MLTTVFGQVTAVENRGPEMLELTIDLDGELRRALNYVAITGPVAVGDTVLLNTTAQTLRLGTGGYDFVMANLSDERIRDDMPIQGYGHGTRIAFSSGHIIKCRYTPSQHAVLTLEEQPEHAAIWERDLEGFPVLVGQLHSQMIPAAAGLKESGHANIVYIMTDAAALPIAFSNAVRAARERGLIAATITCGQAFGGDYETVTVHSALLAAKHLLNADAAIVCQGPGNAGTGTPYGFSGIEQASILDTVAALGGQPIAIVRMSEGDQRERHRGISHHTLTSLRLVRSRCIVPLPKPITSAPSPFQGEGWGEVIRRHDVRFVEGAEAVVDAPANSGLPLSTMGRGIDSDRVFFLSAVSAGMFSRDTS